MQRSQSCQLCPRRCGADRKGGQRGVCGADNTVHIARSALHFWEEPPISGSVGSGTIFFSGCTLKCIFCQNHEISRGLAGLKVSVKRLAQMMLELQAQGAANINLVTPLHYTPHIIEALKLAKHHGLNLPIVCNTGGYELPETIDLIAPYIDIWLTDFKYASSDLAHKLSYARDYPDWAALALERMVLHLRSRGGRRLNDDGYYQQAIIVRHLILPAHTKDSCDVLDRVFEIAGNDVDVSIMNQYTPNKQCLKRADSLSRTLFSSEYERVITYAEDLGFSHIWWQEAGTASESFIPPFDATGVIGPELCDE